MKGLNRVIRQYITNEWIKKAKSNRSFALDHNIDEKTVRRIEDESDNYTMELDTLNKICEARNLKLSEFFMLIEL